MDGVALDFLRSCATEAGVRYLSGPDLDQFAKKLAGIRVGVAPVALPDLISRPAETDLWSWHRQCLLDCLRAPSDSDPTARRIFHARWLLHLLQPDDTGADLRVSVVIPVYNRAGLVVEAVESALQQTHPAIEVIVVDDGSSDSPEVALQPYLPRIRLLRQANRGVASARNLGVRESRGDYICFLDSDNLLDPDAVELWLDMFHAVPDAELCFALPRQLEMGELACVRRPMLIPDGSPDCATQNLARAAMGRRLLMLGLLMPRWLVHAAGGFDERLPKGEDTRFLFHLGLRETKAVAVSRRLNTRRRLPGSLSDDPDQASRASGRTALLILADLLDSPEHWNLIGRAVGKLTAKERWDWACRSEESVMVDARQRFLTGVQQLSERGRDVGLSDRPVLQLLQEGLKEAEGRLWPSHETIPEYHSVIRQVIDLAFADSSPPGTPDTDYWRRDPTLFDGLEPALACLPVLRGT
jgi:hypothetical protein